ncbi:hypothetical protein [Tychonema sp. LEGE 06208]|uniref:hypothetical protein n=1 Tax=Tychonema sp. LEGE 06208 TaxID=1828663 RepID=UPI00187F714D|nr:hypothetical protein [Tychonema sp. LEGE 06208]MBE9165303.1 hypothetical protein [Tychonema sp. LEGE 06208]
MSVSIFIDYKLINDTQWHTIEMSPENYFDLYLDETIRWDCVPKYDKVIDYLNVDRKQVSNTTLRIIDDEASVTKIITTTFWDQGENTIAERLVRGLEKSYWLMVITTKVQDNPAVWEILRLQKENDVPIVEFHSFITDNEDGSETEKIIYPIRED